MSRYVAYDPATGQVDARVVVSDPRQLEAMRPDLLEVDDEDFHSEPETWAEIDVTTRRLRPRPGKADPTAKRRIR